jgi:hypothetical protein
MYITLIIISTTGVFKINKLFIDFFSKYCLFKKSKSKWIPREDPIKFDIVSIKDFPMKILLLSKN